MDATATHLSDYGIDSAPEEQKYIFETELSRLALRSMAWVRPDGSGACKDITVLPVFYGSTISDPWLTEILSPAMETDYLLTPDVPQALGVVKDVLALNTSELARVMLKTRPTIYSWANGEQEVKQENRQRLMQLHEFASAWRSLTTEPLGTLVREKIAGSNSSLIDLLSLEVIPQAQVMEALESLADLVHSRVASQRKHRSMRELAKEHGFQPLNDEEYRANVRHFSQRHSR